MRQPCKKIEFCVKLGMMPTQTNVKITAASMDYKVNIKSIFKWHERVREGRKNKDDSRSGRSLKEIDRK